MSCPILKKESCISADLKKQIEGLSEACIKGGDEGVAYPADDECATHYLLWDGPGMGEEPRLIGALAMLSLSDDCAECIAYVHPDHRRKGYFSRILLAKACEDLPDVEFCFPVRGKNDAVTAVLESIGAEYDRTEYMMELALEPSSPAASDAVQDIYFYPPNVEDNFGHCRLESISPDSVCLYNVEVRPELRNKGYGAAMILALSDELKRHGIRKVTVHVSASNIPAVSLYKKTGFRTTETLSYYLF